MEVATNTYVLQEQQITTSIVAKYRRGFCFCRMWQKILTCLLWVTSCANLKTRAFHLGFFGLTSHKWFLKQEEMTSSLLSAFKFPDCIVKQREPVSAHIHRVILVGRDISRSPGQVSLTAGPTRSGCSGLCRYFSISKDSQSFWVSVTVLDHTMVKIFSCIKICLSMLTPCACCLLSYVLCAPLGKKVSCSLVFVNCQ